MTDPHRLSYKMRRAVMLALPVIALVICSALATSPFGQAVSPLLGAGTAYAQTSGTGAEPLPPAAIPVRHEMKTSPAADLSGIEYSVNAAPITALSASQIQEGGRPVPAAVSPAPLSIVPATAAASQSSTIYAKSFEAAISAETMFGPASAFGLPGVYFFTVGETYSGGSSDAAGAWSYGDEQYLLRLYVVNDGSGGLRYDAASIRALNAGAEGADKLDAMTFTSANTEWRTLTVTKEVEGSFGNAAYDFPIEITLFLPEWYDASAAITPVNATETAAPTRTGDTGPFTAVYEAGLHDGESAAFTVPVGTFYKVDEKSAAGGDGIIDEAGIAYSPEISWKHDNGKKLEFHANEKANSYNAASGMPADVGASSLLVEGDTYTWSEVPSRYGYDFLGWSANPDATVADAGLAYVPGQPLSVTLDESTRDLYAVWLGKPVTIHFDSGITTGASGMSSITTLNMQGSMPDVQTRVGEKFIIPECAFTCQYYNFNAWMIYDHAGKSTGKHTDYVSGSHGQYGIGETGDNPGDRPYIVEAYPGGYDEEPESFEIMFKAIWSGKKYTIHYEVGVHPTPTADVGSKLPTALFINRSLSTTGYKFNGWYTEPNGQGTKADNQTRLWQLMPNDEQDLTIDVYADWTPYEITVSYDLTGGSWLEPTYDPTPAAPLGPDATGLLPDPDKGPVKEGATFVGWGLKTTATTPALTSDDQALVTFWNNGAYNIDNTALTADLTFYAIWAEN